MKNIIAIIPSLYLLVNGVLYCLVAWLFLTNPEQWFASLSLELRVPAGYTELKTLYVGMMGAVGIFYIVSAMGKTLLFPALLFAVLSYGGLALVRAWGIYVTQQSNTMIAQLLTVESIALVMALIALYCLYLTVRKRRNPYL